MKKNDPLSRRERQIMNVLFANGECTVKQIIEELDDAPTEMAIRRLLHILVEKGHLKSRKEGRKVIYWPRESKQKAGAKALHHVLDTFFGGAVDEALATHLAGKEKLSPQQLARMQKLIADAKKLRNK